MLSEGAVVTKITFQDSLLFQDSKARKFHFW